jgi:hypothetical protein
MMLNYSFKGIILNQKKKKTDLNIMEDVRTLNTSSVSFFCADPKPSSSYYPFFCKLSVYGEGKIGYICSLVFGEKNQQKVTFYKKYFQNEHAKTLF